MGRFNDRWSGSPETVDRALVIACAVIWLLVVGMGVAAAVALADLGQGRAAAESASGTPWLLYVVIGVSALVIVAAVPLLLRARQAAEADGAAEPTATAVARRAAPLADRGSPGYAEPPAPAAGESAPPAGALDRIWLRCGVGVLAAMGAALLAVAVAAYMLAVDSDTGAWVALGVAAAITAVMAVIPALSLREVHALTELGRD